MNTLVEGIAGIVAILFALGFLIQATLGGNGILTILSGKGKPLDVALTIGSVIVLAVATIGFFVAFIAGNTEGSLIDKITDSIMKSLESVAGVAGFAVMLFGLGFLLYGLFGDSGLTAVLSGKISPVNAAVTVGAVVLLAAVIFGLYTSFSTGDTTGGSFLTTIYDNVVDGLTNPQPTQPPQ